VTPAVVVIMVTPMRDKDDRERERSDDEAEEGLRADNDLDDFFFDEDEPSTADRRRDPLRKL